ncbi:MAG: DNA/RNA helicase domain-containing protein, partial [Bacteroides sp.]|nr:DNA/RNA helicase domain-containing protein [Bacteroides sp.]
MRGFSIKQHDFNPGLFDELKTDHYAKDLWPIVYILSDNTIKEAYVGETTDTYARMNSHLKSSSKKKLTSVHLIGSPKFNKSATLDIESNLIKYLSGDGNFKLLNGNLGLANHNYYQKPDVYWHLFKSIWDELRTEGLARHSLEHIDNSDLFKYSPYKSLRYEQVTALQVMLKGILNEQCKTVLMEGGAGTGKTILAIFLFKLLATDSEDFNYGDFGDQELEFLELVEKIKIKYPKLKMGFVVPMSSFRATMKQVFKNIKGLKASMVIGPAAVSREKFDILIVDEAHRLRRRKSIGAYIGAFNKAAIRLGLDPNETSELEWVTMQSGKTILFYDEKQSIKPSDVDKGGFKKLKANPKTIVDKLRSQFRVLGGNDYVDFIDKLMQCKLPETTGTFNSKAYEFVLFDSVGQLVSEIKQRDKECGLSRTVAGFSWDWVSNKEGQEHVKDIKIGDTELRWNAVTEDWINSANAVNEVGCIHTTQGYDLNYAGIIFGHEISYDKGNNSIVIKKEHYKDSTGRQTDSAEQLQEYIVNIYKTMMLRGIKGTYLYACDPDLRDYLANYIPVHRSEPEIPQVLFLQPEEVIPYENAIPVYHLDAAAGEFGENQKVSDLDWVKPPKFLRVTQNHFACRIIGESMNKVIPNGSYAVFKRY